MLFEVVADEVIAAEVEIGPPDGLQFLRLELFLH